MIRLLTIPFLAPFLVFAQSESPVPASPPAAFEISIEEVDPTTLPISPAPEGANLVPSTNNPALLPNGATECFSDARYRFGSVSADLSLEVGGTVAGVPLAFTTTMENTNPYPIVDASVYVKIFRVQHDEDLRHQHGDDLIDQFFAKEALTLPAYGTTTFMFDWETPHNVPPGEYRAVTYVSTAYRYNLLGLPFTDDVTGNQTVFTLAGGPEDRVFLAKDTVTVDNQPYSFAAFTPKVSATSSITVAAEVINERDTTEVARITWKLYRWDGQREENLIETRQQGIEVAAGASVPVSYTVTDTTDSVYYLVGTLTWRDSTSILNIRFTRDGVAMPRINFPSVSTYPLRANTPVELFSCLHNAGTDHVVNNNTLTLTLKDDQDRVLHTYTYEGDITGAMMAVADTYTPDADLTSFSLSALLMRDGVTIDEVSIAYDCLALNAPCPTYTTESTDASRTSKQPIVSIVAVLVLLALLGIMRILKRRRDHDDRSPGATSSQGTRKPIDNTSAEAHKGTVVSAVLLVLFASFLALPGHVDAKSTSWNRSYNVMLDYYWSRWGYAGWTGGLANPNVTVTRSAYAFNNGTPITDGAILAIGDVLSFSAPLSATDISWFGTGYSSDSPYGHWISGAAPPGVSCSASDFVTVYQPLPWSPTYRFGVYVPLSVHPSAISFRHTGSAGLSCNASGTRCTVTAPGTVRTAVQYAATQGVFYYRYYQYDWYQPGIPGAPAEPPGCYGNNTPMRIQGGSTFAITVPYQQINFSFIAVAPNTPPNPPQITEQGNNDHLAGSVQRFAIRASDPDNDRIRYAVDWNMDGTIDQWLPSSGYVNSNTPQSTTRTWMSVGSKTFQARTFDDRGGVSGWTSYTINLNNPPLATVRLAANPTTVATGQTTQLSWTSANATRGCVAGGGYWSPPGNRPATGSETSAPLTAAGTITFTITCYNAIWQPVQDTVSVTVVPAPTVSLSANPTIVSAGGTGTNLTWMSTNAQTCTATGSSSFNGPQPLSGTNVPQASITANTTYTITCFNALGMSATHSALVRAAASVPQ